MARSPACRHERLKKQWIEPFPVFRENMNWFIKHRAEIVERCVTTVYDKDDFTHVLAVVDQNQLQHLLSRVVDPNEFLSPFGMRRLSKFHEKYPFTFSGASVGYEPAESRTCSRAASVMVDPEMVDTRMTEGLGARARARGMTMGPSTAPAPKTITLTGLAARLADRIIHIFLPDADGYRPVHGPRGTRKAELFAHDPHWKDLVLFYEYFNAETGEGLGASHQTGWTGLVANVIDEWRR